MRVLSIFFSCLIFFSSCDKQSEVDLVEPLEERGFTEIVEVYLLNNNRLKNGGVQPPPLLVDEDEDEYEH